MPVRYGELLPAGLIAISIQVERIAIRARMDNKHVSFACVVILDIFVPSWHQGVLEGFSKKSSCLQREMNSQN